jgi:hypothetical protein
MSFSHKFGSRYRKETQSFEFKAPKRRRHAVFRRNTRNFSTLQTERNRLNYRFEKIPKESFNSLTMTRTGFRKTGNYLNSSVQSFKQNENIEDNLRKYVRAKSQKILRDSQNLTQADSFYNTLRSVDKYLEDRRFKFKPKKKELSKKDKGGVKKRYVLNGTELVRIFFPYNFFSIF